MEKKRNKAQYNNGSNTDSFADDQSSWRLIYNKFCLTVKLEEMLVIKMQ